MKVAITGYVDFDQAMTHINDTNFMTHTGQLLDDRFEFVLFVHPFAVDFIVPRKNVRVVPYFIGNLLNDFEPGKDNFYIEYPYAKSLKFLKDNRDILLEYDYIIKTDSDVIINPTLNLFKFSDKITVGMQIRTLKTEEEENIKNQLRDFAINKLNKVNYNYYGRMSSTIIGPAKDIIEIHGEADSLCRVLFSSLLPETKWNEGLFRNISTMYATEIAICSKYSKEQVEISDKIDTPSSSNLLLLRDPEPWWNYYHFHCLHPELDFSKFLARKGAYSNANKLNDNSVTSYCVNSYIDFRKENEYYTSDDGKKIVETYNKKFYNLES